MKKLFIVLLSICLFFSIAFAEVSSITVTTASTALASADNTRALLIVKNVGSTTCYITDEATATTSDMELLPKDILIFTGKEAKVQYNAITSSSTTDVRVWTRKS